MKHIPAKSHLLSLLAVLRHRLPVVAVQSSRSTPSHKVSIMSNCHYEVSALLRELFQQNYYRCASYFAYTYRAKAHLFTCSEQFNSFIMDTLFEIDGVEYLRWTDENGNTWEAVYDDVRFLGKEVIEQMPSDFGGWKVEFNIPDENVDPDANGLFSPMFHDIYEYIESLYED